MENKQPAHSGDIVNSAPSPDASKEKGVAAAAHGLFPSAYSAAKQDTNQSASTANNLAPSHSEHTQPEELKVVVTHKWGFLGSTALVLLIILLLGLLLLVATGYEFLYYLFSYYSLVSS